MKYFRGSELQNYFTRILEDNLQSVIKPQYVDNLPKAIKGSVISILDNKAELENKATMIDMLDLKDVLDRDIVNLSGGELQRFAIAVAAVQKRDMQVMRSFIHV